MGFEIPKYLQSYLSSENRKPFANFVNNSQYYAGLNTYYLTYMTRVIRQCMAYSTATVDGICGESLSTNVGFNIVSTATKLIKGDKLLFNGDDNACAFLSDVWSPASGFARFLEKSINYMLSGGTSTIKLNIDRDGKCVLSTSRVDRNYLTTDDCDDVVEALFFISLLASEKSLSGNIDEQYWLIERRYYKDGKAVVEYGVHRKAGTADTEVLPSIYDGGIPYKNLPTNARNAIDRQGIKLNTPLALPFKDGLGVWVLSNTATNSCVPDLYMGDPLLYGALDLLWSLDIVFSGSLIDVINGKGKVLVPRQFVSTLNQQLTKAAQSAGLSKPTLYVNSEFDNVDESFVYVTVEGDKEFIPQSVQFDIRSSNYKEMWELYLRQIAVHTGFSPSSLFPFLSDVSAKTAREVTAEENLTRSTVQSKHSLILPVLNRAIKEVLFQNGFKGTATLQLSDYIGNKLERDNNIRQNYEIGLTPKDIAVQLVNGLDKKETQEYLDKLMEDEEQQQAFGDDTLNEFKDVVVDYE